MNNLKKIISTERIFTASPQKIFAAFANAQQLAKWWGPNGFTNTFELFELKNAGRWVFVMHGPDGTNYANENVFIEIVPNQKIVIQHVVEPLFTLTVELAAHSSQTLLTWVQAFESAEFAEQHRDFLLNANQQVLNRLEDVLAN